MSRPRSRKLNIRRRLSKENYINFLSDITIFASKLKVFKKFITENVVFWLSFDTKTFALSGQPRLPENFRAFLT